MVVSTRMALVAVAAGTSAAVFLLPSGAAVPVVTGGAALAFGLYAVRTGRALRRVAGALDRLLELERARSRSPEDAGGAGGAGDRLAADQRWSGRLDAIEAAVGRFDEVGKELSALHAVAATEALTRMGAHQRELVGRLDGVDRRLDRAMAGLARVERRLGRAEQRLGHAATQTELHRLHLEALLAARHQFRQTEALVGLHSSFPVRSPLPPSRGWAASPDILLYLTSLVLERRPRLVVELGSGLSTVWLSYALERAAGGGRSISLDHDARFATRTRELLVAHGLDGITEVRHAPLVDVELAGEVWRWYDLASIADIAGCELLFVDGPPAATQKHARYPAVPLLAGKLARHATVVVDDCTRQDEEEIVTGWCRQSPEWRVEMLDHEKGTAVLTRM